MPVTYQPAPADVVAMTKRLVKQFHPHLLEHKVKIDVVMAFGPVDEDGEKIGPAMTLGGYQCLGIASITKLKERVKGDGDCEIALDGDQWPDLSEREREALIDHELTHFLIMENDDGTCFDDLGRPRLSMRLHDWDVGFFHSIAERYGAASCEVQAFRGLCGGRDGHIYTRHLTADGATSKDFEVMLARLIRAAKSGSPAKLGPVLSAADDLLRRRGSSSPLKGAE